MSVEGGEAAADALTGVVAGRTVEPEAGNARTGREAVHPVCLNCGVALTGAYCASCGQSAHIHRSFRSLGHDILHSVFHFEGKFWRTIPELVFHPGRLTRRYIDGERAKFISPMALFLFTVFVMYGIFALLPDMDWNDPPPFTGSEELGAVDSIGESMEAVRLELEDPGISPSQRAELELQMRSFELSRALMQASASGEGERYEELQAEYEEAEGADAADAERTDSGAPTPSESAQDEGTNPFSRALQKLEENPDLVFYKMKSNGFKWSWLLVPFSIPFMWALFFWRREFALYDHAIFVTYSIRFMMILLILSTLAQIAGAGGGVQVALLMLLPPLHLYKQLRGTYRLSRLAALLRLFFVLIAAVVVLSAFVTMLLLIGALE